MSSIDPKELRKLTNDILKDEDLLDMLNIRKLFNKAKNKELHVKKRLDILSETLLLITARTERLYYTRLRIKTLKAVATRQLDSGSLNLKKEKGYSKLTRKAQDSLVEINCFELVKTLKYIEYKLDMINDALTYLKEASFNMKTLLSTFKEYLDGE